VCSSCHHLHQLQGLLPQERCPQKHPEAEKIF